MVWKPYLLIYDKRLVFVENTADVTASLRSLNVSFHFVYTTQNVLGHLWLPLLRLLLWWFSREALSICPRV